MMHILMVIIFNIKNELKVIKTACPKKCVIISNVYVLQGFSLTMN